ncbi:hypothetical protein PHYSODRAFT_332585 [Phytophthora sojae]|uniref:Uncharacterized protein n=1 Tax=Phytophthora sojae (strain P6497) TaxID=1094619 RepID=G4ZJJ4_PHYSP|nr:hypothetical protein PHYSODRAFT_332585 [Phytophthora sojae]EGZ18859.1 hypothetical protein PHYSODRAFT_332585 [Phytophthora sojae]|eukprot:XP_009527917.1 hypothetical protein PHYSODRAFT_332585 [Phytophthora sojae]
MASSEGLDTVTNCRIPLPGQMADPVPSRPFLSGSSYHIRPWDENRRNLFSPPLFLIMARTRHRRPAPGRPDAPEAPYEADATAPRTRVADTHDGGDVEYGYLVEFDLNWPEAKASQGTSNPQQLECEATQVYQAIDTLNCATTMLKMNIQDTATTKTPSVARQ